MVKDYGAIQGDSIMIITWLLSIAPSAGFFFGLIFSVMGFALTVVDKAFYPKASFWEMFKRNVIESLKGAIFTFRVVMAAVLIMVGMFNSLLGLN